MISPYNPEKDGISHINIYSKGNTALGRFLSNWAYSPIDTEDGRFNSIEGYWYWLSCRSDSLRGLYGFEAKKIGRELTKHVQIHEPEFERKILEAVDLKLKSNKTMLSKLKQCKLPLTHYYVYGGKVLDATEGSEFIIKHLEKIKCK